MYEYFIINERGQFEETTRDELLYYFGKRATEAMEASAKVEVESQRNGRAVVYTEV